MRDFQNTVKASRSPKGTFSTSKHEISSLFSFCGSFQLPWIQIPKQDPDPQSKQQTAKKQENTVLD
jgi:hypothetical protein